MAYKQPRPHPPYEEIEDGPYLIRSRGGHRSAEARDHKTYDFLPTHRPGNNKRNATNDMVSRRRILSRSRDDLNLEVAYQEEEDDVWYKKEKLYSDHIREVLTKWDSIDDEIWAKIIVFERNRRVAKAYARVGVLTIHGSDMGFDGSKIGLCGFDNPLRDPKIENAKRYIGAGVKIKMDKDGNMMVKRLAKSNVYVRYATGENAVSSEILKLPQAALEANKGLALFDLKKFHQNVNREMKRQYPDRTRLETQCMTSLAFVKNDDDLLNCPCWVLIINIVALDMLKGKLMPVPIAPSVQPASRSARIPIPDEDPYSMAGSGGSSGSSGKQARTERPPKLPPRDTDRNGRGDSADYADDADDMELTQNGGISGMRARLQSSRSKNKKDRKKGDELYYAGFQARIPNFAKSKPSRDYPRDPRAAYMAGPHGMPMPHPAMMQSRSYESGMELEQVADMPHSHLHGWSAAHMHVRLPPSFQQRRAMYVSNWQ